MNRAEFREFNSYFGPILIGTDAVYIYALIDPRTEQCRYIGKSQRPVERLTNHMAERSNCHRSHWLQSLRKGNLKPRMSILEVVFPCSPIPWQMKERYWIDFGRRAGWPLTNNTDGGDGVSGLPAETRARMAAVWTGRKHKPESIEKMRVASSTQRHSSETKARMSAARKGRQIHWIGKVASALRKLTDAQVSEIAARLGSGELGISLAREFGVHRTTISKIKTGTYYVK